MSHRSIARQSSGLSRGLWLALLLCLPWVSSAVQARELKVAVVNLPKIFQQSPQADAIRQKLGKEFASDQKELEGMTTELSSLNDKLNKADSSMKDDERQRLQDRFVRRQREYAELNGDVHKRFNARRAQEFQKLQAQVGKIIDAMIKKEKYDLVLVQGVYYAGDSLDITNKVMAKLKAEAAKK